MRIKIVNKSKHSLPEYGTEYAAGMDLRANLDQPVILKTLERRLIPTGLFIELPAGTEVQIRPRTGLAIRKGIIVLNTPLTVDAGCRGEIMVILVNMSADNVVIEDGDRICQMSIARYERIEWKEVDGFSESKSGTGGPGNTNTD